MLWNMVTYLRREQGTRRGVSADLLALSQGRCRNPDLMLVMYLSTISLLLLFTKRRKLTRVLEYADLGFGVYIDSEGYRNQSVE